MEPSGADTEEGFNMEPSGSEHSADFEETQRSEGVPSFQWLHHAAEIGDLIQISCVLNNLEKEARHHHLMLVNNGEFPVHCAARGGHIDILELLLPEDLPQLTDAKCKDGGWSSLHLAAAFGHTDTVQWLFATRMANLNVQDNKGNTPLHLAVTLGHKGVVKYLVAVGADLWICNQDGMMPVSFCNDTSIFEALFSAYTAGSASFRRATPTRRAYWPSDSTGRNILHYAAQFSTDSGALATLIVEMDPKQLDNRDQAGDSFLHVAAKSGNLHILQALQRLGSILIDLKANDPQNSPALYALLHNHRKFFDEFITMTKVEITLSCIIKELIAELIGNAQIQKRLVLFATTLPTYLALYANKDCIFDFLLETNRISLSQWDDEHKRTCLHWAVLDKRADIIQKLCQNVLLSPGIQDRDGKTALQHAFEQKNHMVMDILRARHDFKDYEEKLYRDRDVYVQALNAILVGAALIASVTFAGWLQWPPTADFKSKNMKIFWASNSTSFFTAVAAMCVTIAALLPTPNRYVGDIVKKLGLAIVMDAGLLVLSLAAVMCAFATIGYAAIKSSHIFGYLVIMRATIAVAGTLAGIMWAAFVVQVWNCTPPKSVLFSLMLPHRFRRWVPGLGRPSGADNSSAYSGYSSLGSKELESLMEKDLMEKDLVPMQGAPAAQATQTTNFIDYDGMKRLLQKLVISDKNKFINETHKRSLERPLHQQRKDKAVSDITSKFNVKTGYNTSSQEIPSPIPALC